LKTNHIKNECLGIAKECQTNFHYTTVGCLTLNSSQSGCTRINTIGRLPNGQISTS